MDFTFASDRYEQELNNSEKQVNSFFEELKNNPQGIMFYRNSQAKLSKKIMEAIKDNKILLMEAGVGIGKTFGYLIPIFYTHDNVTSFDKIIISTSSIALQEQLLRDIDTVSKMLGIEIKYGIAKGINNYACLKKIEDIRYGYRTDKETKEIMDRLATEIRKIRSSDKADLREFSEDIWERVQLRNRGKCSNCDYSRRCPYYLQQENLKVSNIIVTNHAYMAYNATNGGELVQDADFVVYDEAHKLPETIRSINEGELRIDEIKDLIRDINTLLNYRYSNEIITYNSRDNRKNNNSILFDALDNLFSRVMASASKNFFESQKKIGDNGSYSVTDGGRIGFWFTPSVKENIGIVVKELEKIFLEITSYKNKNKIKIDDKILAKLKSIYMIFKDMQKCEESNNVYWASYYAKNRISINYVSKDITKTSEQLFFDNNIPQIMLSGTLDAPNDYQIIDTELSLTQQAVLNDKDIDKSETYSSPYNYKDNALFYYDETLPPPNKSIEYKKELASKVSELIRATNGKALVLFTSKKTMNDVYDALKNEEFPFELLLQTDNNTAEVKEHFIKDTDSCLFATGAFWEGIDIKGPSLSNVIITQLPFETYDAVNQYLSKNNTNENTAIHIPKMVMKLTQGVGRLIRSSTDTGIVCCIDSRTKTYLDAIKKSIPIPTITSDMKDVYDFIDSKILVSDDKGNELK